MTRALQVGAALVLLTYFWVLVRARPTSVLRAARHDGTTRSESPTSSPRFAQIVSAVERAASLHPLQPRCLEQSLSARALLSVYGERARVVIGVSKSHDGIDAHAWLESGGTVNDAARPAYVKLTDLP